MKSKNYVIDLRDWQLEDNPHDVPPKVKLDLRDRQSERQPAAAGSTLNLRPEPAEQFYEAVPGAGTARQPIQAFMGRDVRPVRSKRFALPWKTLTLLLVPVGLAALVITQAARSSDLPAFPALTNNPAAQPQPDELGEQQPISEEGGRGTDSTPPATPPPSATTTPQPNQTNTGGGTGSDGGGTGGGSLDPAVDACVTIPGSTVCQSGSVDPTASDPIKVEGTDL